MSPDRLNGFQGRVSVIACNKESGVPEYCKIKAFDILFLFLPDFENLSCKKFFMNGK